MQEVLPQYNYCEANYKAVQFENKTTWDLFKSEMKEVDSATLY